MMTSARSPKLPRSIQPPSLTSSAGRNALGPYILSPESYPKNVVICYSDQFVVLNDAFPKSSLHLLLMPRDREKALLHPIAAFEDAVFLSTVREEVAHLKKQVASELRRKFGRFSASEQARIDAMAVDPPLDILPEGRLWEKEIICGVHAGPSMNHLHVHVLSVDRHSERMRHRKHYNSFATPFLIPLEGFPLSKSDPRRHPGGEGYLRRDLICWRCGQNFKNKFQNLKLHLESEFEEWKRE